MISPVVARAYLSCGALVSDYTHAVSIYILWQAISENRRCAVMCVMDVVVMIQTASEIC